MAKMAAQTSYGRAGLLLIKPALLLVLTGIALVLALQHLHTVNWMTFLGFGWYTLGEFSQPTLSVQLPSHKRSLYRTASCILGGVCFIAVMQFSSPYSIWNSVAFIVMGVMMLLTIVLYVFLIPRGHVVQWRFGLIHGLVLSVAVAAAGGLAAVSAKGALLALLAMEMLYVEELLINWVTLKNERFLAYPYIVLTLLLCFATVLFISILLPYL